MKRKKLRTRQSEEQTAQFFRLGLFLLPLLLIGGPLYLFGLPYLRGIIPADCVFLQLTGYYCPGCGGTRSLYLLLHGRPLLAIWYHPFLMYVIILWAVFMLTNAIERLSKGRWQIGLQYRHRYIVIGLIMLFVNFIIRDVLLYLGIDTLLYHPFG